MRSMSDVSNEAIENRTKLALIKRAYLSGSIDRNEAKRQAEPILQMINDKAKSIAIKNNRTYSPIINFVSAMRDSYSDIPRSRFVVDESDLLIIPPKTEK